MNNINYRIKLEKEPTIEFSNQIGEMESPVGKISGSLDSQTSGTISGD